MVEHAIKIFRFIPHRQYCLPDNSPHSQHIFHHLRERQSSHNKAVAHRVAELKQQGLKRARSQFVGTLRYVVSADTPSIALLRQTNDNLSQPAILRETSEETSY